jgi:4-hydroxy-3-methylbut-2-enyl diphosphate reductase
VARDAGLRSHLIEDETRIDPAWLDGVEVVGITSGASVPERLVQRVVTWFRARGTTDVSELDVVAEDVAFALPRPIRRALALVDR